MRAAAGGCHAAHHAGDAPAGAAAAEPSRQAAVQRRSGPGTLKPKILEPQNPKTMQVRPKTPWSLKPKGDLWDAERQYNADLEPAYLQRQRARGVN